MKNQGEKIIDTLLLKNGFDFDMDEGWLKLITSQFGGSPGRAFSELIQNMVDSYPSHIPLKDRKGEIATEKYSICIKDWGEGLSTKRLSLLATAGGTDKLGNHDKIGRFGLGFISIFNPQLATRRVEVLTKCEDHVVEMVFTVTDPKKRPDISARVIDTSIDFSTSITVVFGDSSSVRECLNYAEKSLNYYPCPISINGKLFRSAWQTNGSERVLSFSENHCDGLIQKDNKWLNTTVLCKFELVMNTTLSHFITGGHNMNHNLVDFEKQSTPYIPNISILFSINNLTLVISRDNYYMDWNYTMAKSLLNRKLRQFLYLELEKSPDIPVIIANQYIFRREIKECLDDPENSSCQKDENRFLKILTEYPVYRINGRSGLFSLAQLTRMRSKGLPLYFSPHRTNLRWLGGSFKHDFIVIPEPCSLHSGTPLLYDKLFETVWKDVVNLDTIGSNHSKIQDLAARGLIDKSALSPDCRIVGSKNLSVNQQHMIEELSVVLNDRDIQEIIGNNLQLPVASVTPVFFSIREEGAYISTGIFSPNGNPISEDHISNLTAASGRQDNESLPDKKLDLLLGLNLNHPFINFLVESTSRHKEYYTLTYLAHELALCQKMLVPYSPYYHLVKEKLAYDMRKAMINNLLKNTLN